MSDLDDLIRLQSHVKRLIAFKKRRDAMSGKDYSTMSQRQVQKNGAELSWIAMDIDKATHEAHAAAVDCGLADPRSAEAYGTVDYWPSSLHHYKHKPTLPRCRQEEIR